MYAAVCVDIGCSFQFVSHCAEVLLLAHDMQFLALDDEWDFAVVVVLKVSDHVF